MTHVDVRTGTTNNVDKKFDKYESKYGCELFCLPSMSIVFGISGTKLKAALKQASAEKCPFIYVKYKRSSNRLNIRKINLAHTLT